MRRYYSEYVSHCLTFYCRYPSLSYFRSEVDRRNWQSCHVVLSALPEDEIDIVMSVYAANDVVKNSVSKVARDKKISQEKVWKTIGNVERKIAAQRGLV